MIDHQGGAGSGQLQDVGGASEPLLTEETHILEVYLSDLHAAIDQAVSAERLGFSWRLDSYMCPVGKVDSGTEQREYRLVVWKRLLCPRLPMSYGADPSEDSDPEAEQ